MMTMMMKVMVTMTMMMMIMSRMMMMHACPAIFFRGPPLSLVLWCVTCARTPLSCTMQTLLPTNRKVHSGENEYCKRVLFLMEQSGSRPIAGQEKRIIVQKFAHFQQFSRPGAKGNTFARIPEEPRCEAAFVFCQRKDFIEHRHKLNLFGQPPSNHQASTSIGTFRFFDEKKCSVGNKKKFGCNTLNSMSGSSAFLMMSHSSNSSCFQHSNLRRHVYLLVSLSLNSRCGLWIKITLHMSESLNYEFFISVTSQVIVTNTLLSMFDEI